MRSLLSLPAPVLRALSGGAAVHRGGRTLDPRLQFLSRHVRPADEAPQSPTDHRERQAAADRDLSGAILPGVAVEPLTIAGPEGELRGRLYRTPRRTPPRALLLWFPSGGGVLPGLARDETFCSMLAGLGCLVVAVQPRLAPEHRFPAALQDASAALAWARREAGGLGAPALAVGGADLGAGLAAGVCRDPGGPSPVLQVLVSPWLDLAARSPSTAFAESWPVTAADLAWRAAQVLGAGADPSDPRVSPLRASRVAGQPPAVVITTGFDPLAEQGEAYARRLREAGVPVRYRRHDALAHDFHTMTGAVPAADAACREAAALVRDALEDQAPTA